MGMKKKVLAASVLAGAFSMMLSEGTAQAQAQAIPPIVERDSNWDTVSAITMMIGVGSVSLMPRIYYSSPDATVGWKARWHISHLAPVMSMTGATLLIDGPLREAIESPKDGCTLDNTLTATPRIEPDSGCESYGGPSTHSFASWGATGAGVTIFLVDTFKYSNSEFHVGSFIGNVAIPFTTSILTSVARSADGSGIGPEGTGQVIAGALPGLAFGALMGLGYSLLQEPDCGYGGSLVCW
jgi:hypothetical protein